MSRSRRLQKKLYLGEFAKTGFNFEGQLIVSVGTKDDAVLILLDFLSYLELEGLISGCAIEGQPKKIKGVVATQARYGKTTAEHQDFVKEWLSTYCSNVMIGQHYDLIYCDDGDLLWEGSMIWIK